MALIKQKLIALLWLGSISFLVGISQFFIDQRGGVGSWCLLAVGLGLIIFFIVKLKSMSVQTSKTSRLKKGLYYFLIVLLLSVLWAEVNFLSTLTSWRMDVTRARQHTLSENSLAVLADLDQTVKVTAFYVDMAPKYLEDMLDAYERNSNGLVTTEIIDPVQQIGYAAQFDTVISSKEKKVIVQSGLERREINFDDKPLSEEDLTNTILRVTRKSRTVYFLTGHGENDLNDKDVTGLSVFAGLLNKNRIQTRSLMLGIEKAIPEDCDVLVIAGPRKNLSPRDEEIIKDYLNRGGDALFLIEHVLVTTPDKPLTEEELKKNPSLNSILNEWGVRVADDIVVDLTSYTGQDVGCPATRNYMPHEALLNGLDYTFYIRPRSISKAKTSRPGLKVVPFVLTESSENSWGETNRTLHVHYDPGVDRPGPVPISYIMFEPKGDQKESDTRIIVFTDADFLTNAYVTHYTNSQMGLNIIQWLSELDYQLMIDRDVVKVERLQLTSQQKRTVATVLFLMPFCVILVGLSVWVMQKD